MKFLTKSQEYITTYTKEQAINLLKKDKRVEKVEKIKDSMIIYTKPIIPTCSNPKFKNIFLCPIGKYTIKIVDSNSYGIYLNISRNNGGVDLDITFNKTRRGYTYFVHLHVTSKNNIYSTECWGNINTEIETICRNKDWYWLGIRCLELLYDAEPEVEIEEDKIDWYIKIFMRLQAKYAYIKKDYKTIHKLEKIFREQLKKYHYHVDKL